VAAARKLLQEQIGPAWVKASNSRNPDDAKALVPLIDQLDRHMDNLLTSLSGH